MRQSNIIRAFVIMDDQQFWTEYDSTHEHGFIGTAYKLLKKAIELDLDTEVVEPCDMEGLKLVAQLQLLDESTMRSYIREVGEYLNTRNPLLAAYPGDIQLQIDRALVMWREGCKPGARRGNELRERAVHSVIDILREVYPNRLNRIFEVYTGKGYQVRFFCALLEYLTTVD